MDQPLVKQEKGTTMEKPLNFGGRERTLSVAEMDGIEAALQTMKEESGQLEADGLSQVSFFLGILNAVLITFVFAKYPEHLWLLYGIECFVLIPAWWIRMITRYDGALFILDFCWVANICFAVYMVLAAFDLVPGELRYCAFVVFFACSLGPLGWACLTLHNALVFHSVERITSLFIHMMPALVGWSLAHYPERVAEAWPGRFPTQQEMEAVTFAEVWCYGFSVYSVWLVLHAAWLLSIGVRCPDSGHRTVFSDLYEKKELGPVFVRSTGLQGLRSHATLYLLLHCVACALTFVFPGLCLVFPGLHAMFNATLLVAAAWVGAGYYHYIFAMRYTKVVQNMLEERAANSRRV